VLTRRGFLGALGAGLSGALAARASAQSTTAADTGAGPQTPDAVRTTMSGPMNDNAYRPVERPPKPGAGLSMTAPARDELEHHLHCQCGCTLDVFTCRTTDFTCPISPAMHQDVVRLVRGGYSGPEIMAAFRAGYGERVLMAPVREGFNWTAYITPFVAIGAGATLVAVLIRRWRGVADQRLRDRPVAVARADGQATPEELARLEAAIRDDTA
jgi:cytochrome c-type biogenesis protein CcmH